MSEKNNSKQATEENKPKFYQPEDIRSPWATIFLVAVIIVGFHMILTGYWQAPLKTYLFGSLIMAGGIWFCSLLIYYNYAYCLYIKITDEEITGKNTYKMSKRELKFNEIKEMWLTKRIIVIHLKDIYGNRLGIAFRDEFIPVLQELLEKSVNCTRIDFNYDYYKKKIISTST